MAKFIDEKTGVEVDTDGQDGGFIVKIPRHKPLELTRELSLSVSAQLAFAEEYVNLYERVR